MKIRLISDLHCDFYPKDIIKVLNKIIPTLETDSETTLVLAGDVGDPQLFYIVLKYLSKRFKYVIYCLGNHDYYDLTLKEAIDEHKTIASKFNNVYFLEKTAVELEGITFAGGTLWSNYSLFYTPLKSLEVAEYNINDFRRIRGEKTINLRGNDVVTEFNETVKFLKTLKGKNNLVVITHHAPSFKSIHNDYATNALTPAYASDLEDFILDLKPRYWLHGHLHNYSHYKIGDCEVIENCYGYYNYEENGMYFEKMTFDI